MKLTHFVIAAIVLAGGTPRAQSQPAETTGHDVHAPAAPAVNMLANPDFEGNFRTLTSQSDSPNAKSQITGQTATGWYDNSGWGDLTIEYAIDHANSHNGRACQRIDVQRVKWGSVQFVQGVVLKAGHTYDASCWMRAETPGVAMLQLRQEPAPYRSYGGQSALVTADWTHISFAVTIPADVDSYFMVSPASEGTWWVDDCSVTDVTDAASAAPAKTGNLLPNGSFEAGLGGGWSVGHRCTNLPAVGAAHETADLRYSIDRATATQGDASLRVIVPTEGAAVIDSPPVDFNYGRPYTVSLDLKASREGVPIWIQLEGSPVRKDIYIGTHWQRYAVSGVLPYARFTRLHVTCWLGEDPPAVIWMDGASLQEGAIDNPNYTPANPVEMTLGMDRPGSIFFDGEPARIEIRANRPPAGAHLKMSVNDLYGGNTPLPDLPLPANNVVIPPDPRRPRGMFKLNAQVVGNDGTALSAPVEQIFARLPHPRDIDPTKSFFGVHIPLAPLYFKIARATGSRWVRLLDCSVVTKWAVVEPERDQWQFFDDGVENAREAGLQVLGMLDGAPWWASTKPMKMGTQSMWNMPDVPDAREKWTQYVSRTVGHYRGLIDYWEVWNEPWGPFFVNNPVDPGTPQYYGELLKLAYPAAKAANPGVTILGIDGAMGRESFTEGALSVANSKYYDAFSFHNYDNSLYGGPQTWVGKAADAFNAEQKKYGEVKPLWDTEGGPGWIDSWYGPEDLGTGLGPRPQLAQAVRFNVAQIGAGVQHFFLYWLAGYPDPPYGEGSITALECDRSIRPTLAARAVLASLVDGVPYQGRTEPVPGVDAYRFGPDGNKTVTVLWSYRGGTHKVAVPEGVTVLDVQGNRLTPGRTIDVSWEPIYFIG